MIEPRQPRCKDDGDVAATPSGIRVNPTGTTSRGPSGASAEPVKVHRVRVVGQAEHPQDDHPRIEEEDPERPESHSLHPHFGQVEEQTIHAQHRQ